MFTAIRDVSLALRKLVEARFQAEPLLASSFPPDGTLAVSLSPPDGMEVEQLQGLSLWLHRVTRDEFTLNRPAQRVAPDRLRQPPLPLRLHYLITPMVRQGGDAAAPELEQLLLGKVLEIFHTRPRIEPAELTPELAGQGVALAVRLETPSLDEMARIWEASDRPYRLCLAYEVSLLLAVEGAETRTGPPVEILRTELGLAG